MSTNRSSPSSSPASSEAEALRRTREQAELRWPDLGSDPDRETWVLATTGQVNHVGSEEFRWIEAGLDRKQKAIRTPDTSPGASSEPVQLGALVVSNEGAPATGSPEVGSASSEDLPDELTYGTAMELLLRQYPGQSPEDYEAAAAHLSGDADPRDLAGAAALQRIRSTRRMVAPAVGDLTPWIKEVHGALGVRGQPADPMEPQMAEQVVTTLLPDMGGVRKELCVLALQGYSSATLADGQEVEITSRELALWRQEADRTSARTWIGQIARKAAQAEAGSLGEQVQAEAVDLLRKEFKQTTSSTSWQREPSTILVIAAVFVAALGLLILAGLDLKSKRTYEARLDEASAGVVRDREGKFVQVSDHQELLDATGFSADEAEFKAQVIKNVSGLRADVRELQDKHVKDSGEADRAKAQLKIAEKQKEALKAERALDKKQLDAATKAASAAATQASRAGERAARAEAAAMKAAQAAERSEQQALRTATQWVRSGSCQKSLEDFIGPDGSAQSRWKCGGNWFQCRGTSVSTAASCIGVDN